jgi:hypothetical protein
MNSPTRKEETMANQGQYRAVLEDLMKQRSALQYRIGEIDAAVAALKRLMPDEPIAEQKIAPEQRVLGGVPGRYTGLGVRMAVLQLLSEHAIRPMRTTEMAQALLAGGITTTGKRFRGNVAAVVSEMYKKRGELTTGPNGGWMITEKGKQVWIQAKTSRDQISSPTFFEQPSVQ